MRARLRQQGASQHKAFLARAPREVQGTVARAAPELEAAWLAGNRKNRAKIRKDSGALLAACTRTRDRARAIKQDGSRWQVVINLIQATFYPPPPQDAPTLASALVRFLPLPSRPQ